jgi:hypothetical protein
MVNYLRNFSLEINKSQQNIKFYPNITTTFFKINSKIIYLFMFIFNLLITYFKSFSINLTCIVFI